MSAYDVIVLGTGGVGSAAALHLAQRGARVLGLDRFPPGHARGSSHGHTRIIRKAYFEHPDYVPLLNRAYELWEELEQQSGQQLYYPVGLIEVGPPGGVVLPGVRASAEQHGLAVEQVSAVDFAARFPGFVVPVGYEAVFERDAGYLLVEDAVRAQAAEAARSEAELRHGETVLNWQASAKSVAVTTTTATFTAAALVVTAGAWSGCLLADLGLSLKVLRKHLHWFACGPRHYRAEANCPAFFYETDDGCFYGFPALDERGVKIAEHSGGTVVRDPLKDDQRVEERDRQRVVAFLQHHMPNVTAQATDHAVCYYTVSADEHFIVDRHPAHANVVFAAGLSGHGFKFTTVLGEILADLAVQRRASQPIDFLSCRRFAE